LDAGYAPGHSPIPARCIVIRPNRSLSARAAVWLLAAYVGFMLVIGVGFSVTGAWMILPFAGAEALVVVAAFYYLLQRRGDDRELVVLDGETLSIIKQLGQAESRHDFPRYWTKVSLERYPRGWYPSRLTLRSHGRVVEVGSSIREEDRQVLAEEVRSLIGHTAYTQS
jgi:uncharacterized membrane protein